MVKLMVILEFACQLCKKLTVDLTINLTMNSTLVNHLKIVFFPHLKIVSPTVLQRRVAVKRFLGSLGPKKLGGGVSRKP